MPLFASDFSSLTYFVIVFVLGIAMVCLIAGVITARAIVQVTKQRWIWWLVPVFAAVWFGIGWIALAL